METFVRPLALGELPENIQPILQALRSEEGEEPILEQNLFVEKFLPRIVLRPLTEEEMAV